MCLCVQWYRIACGCVCVCMLCIECVVPHSRAIEVCDFVIVCVIVCMCVCVCVCVCVGVKNIRYYDVVVCHMYPGVCEHTHE